MALTFSLPQPASVELSIFDATGRRVRQLLHGTEAAGPHAIDWNRAAATGPGLTSGVYFCRLRAGTLSRTIRLTHVR